MLDVHVPHPTHTWRDFFIHIATICVGLLIAVGLEQSVEAVHRHHEATSLREDLHTESDQVLADTLRTGAAMDFEIRWLDARIPEAKEAAWEHHPVPAFTPLHLPRFASPDIPIWRSAKASALTPLLSKGEVNAFSEVEYVQTHLDLLVNEAERSRTEITRFVSSLPSLPNGQPDFSKARPEDLHQYLDLLTASRMVAADAAEWLRILRGAETASSPAKPNRKTSTPLNEPRSTLTAAGARRRLLNNLPDAPSMRSLIARGWDSTMSYPPKTCHPERSAQRVVEGPAM